MKTRTPEQALAGFIGKFTPAMASRIRKARAKMRARIPRALELVYDNYNFFVIGTDRTRKRGTRFFRWLRRRRAFRCASCRARI